MTFLCLKIICLLVLPIDKGVLCQKLIPGQVELIEGNLEKIYQCNFNVLVDCLWKKNGTTIRILPQYYLTNYGKNTLDCSFNATGTDDNILYKMECLGIEKPTKTLQHITAFQGKSIELNCSLKLNLKCTWYRNGGVVNVDNKNYKFTTNHGTNNCSIKIMKLKTIDAGHWKCGAKESSQFATSGNEIEFHIELKNKTGFLTELSDFSRSGNKTKFYNELKNEEVGLFSTVQTESSSVKVEPTTFIGISRGHNNNSRPIAYEPVLGFVGIISLIVVRIILIVKYVRKKNRKILLKQNTETAIIQPNISTIELEIQPYAVSQVNCNIPRPHDSDQNIDSNGYLIPKTLVQEKNYKGCQAKTNYYNYDVTDNVENHFYEQIETSINE